MDAETITRGRRAQLDALAGGKIARAWRVLRQRPSRTIRRKSVRKSTYGLAKAAAIRSIRISSSGGLASIVAPSRFAASPMA